MIKTFSSKELDVMSQRRPKGYREDILKIATPKLGVPGSYELDFGSPEYMKLKTMYAIPVHNPIQARQELETKIKAALPKNIQAKAQMMNRELLLVKSKELTELLGPVGSYSIAYQVFRDQERRGACTSCKRNTMLAKVYFGLKADLLKVGDAIRIKAREILGGEYLEIVPVLLKWDDIIGKP